MNPVNLISSVDPSSINGLFDKMDNQFMQINEMVNNPNSSPPLHDLLEFQKSLSHWSNDVQLIGTVCSKMVKNVDTLTRIQ